MVATVEVDRLAGQVEGGPLTKKCDNAKSVVGNAVGFTRATTRQL